MSRVVEAEDQRSRALARQIADLRVVPVHHQDSVRRQLLRHLPPALGEVLELAVAIELVAEQVPEADGPRPGSPRDLRQRRLVHLEQAQLSAFRGQERGRHAGDEVRARPVTGQANLRCQDLRDHRRSRRLAVRGRNEHGTERQPACQAVERIRIEGRNQLSGHRRPAAGPDEPREPCRCAGGRDPDGQGDSHHRRSVATPRDALPIPETGDLRGPHPKG